MAEPSVICRRTSIGAGVEEWRVVMVGCPPMAAAEVKAAGGGIIVAEVKAAGGGIAAAAAALVSAAETASIEISVN